MAIAFNSAAALGDNGGTTNSLTAAYTVGSGTNRFLFAAFLGDVVGGNDDVTGVTYAGTSMTAMLTNTAGHASTNRIIYIYGLANPASGSNNIVITCTNSHYIELGAADYTGVIQGTPASAFDGSGTNQAASSTTVVGSFTTTVNNDWAFGMASVDGTGDTYSYSGGYTQRAIDSSTFSDWSIFDSNGPISPAGAQSITVTISPTAGNLKVALGGFSPASGLDISAIGMCVSA